MDPAGIAAPWPAALVSRVVPREGHRGDLVGHDGRAADRLRRLRHGRASRDPISRPRPRRQHESRAAGGRVQGRGALRVPLHRHAASPEGRDGRACAPDRCFLMAFARPQYLVETEWLAQHLDDPGVRVLECTVYLHPKPEGGFRVESGHAKWADSHIPGAGFDDLTRDLSDRTSSLNYMTPSA